MVKLEVVALYDDFILMTASNGESWKALANSSNLSRGDVIEVPENNVKLYLIKKFNLKYVDKINL